MNIMLSPFLIVLAFNIGIIIYNFQELFVNWNNFQQCSYPLNIWDFLIMFTLIANQACTYLIGQIHLYVLAILQSALNIIFISLTVVGHKWILDVEKNTPECLPGELVIGDFISILVMAQVFCLFSSLLSIILIMQVWEEVNNYQTQHTLLGRSVNVADALAAAGANVSNISTVFRWSFQEQNQDKAKTLGKEDIEAMPLYKWKNAEGDDCLEKFGRVCVVCQDDFEEGEVQKRLKCSHCFHVECIDVWLLKRNKCPMCQQCVLDD